MRNRLSASSSTSAAELRIAQLMTPNPVIVDGEASIADARRILSNYRFRHLPVVSVNEPIGILSDRDMRLAACLPEKRIAGSDEHERQVVDIMTKPVVALSPDESVAVAAEAMITKRVGTVVVVESGAVVGILTESDLLAAFLEACRRSDYANDGLVRYRMHQPAPVISPVVDVVDALEALDPSLDHMVVVESGAMVGFVSARDLLEGMARSIRTDQAAESEGSVVDPRVPVRAVMADQVVTAAPGDPLSRVAAAMLGHKFSALPVLDGTEVVGVITQRHLLSHFVDNS